MEENEKNKSLLVVPQNQEKSEKELMTENWVYKAFVKMAYRLINKPLSIFRIVKDVIAHLQKYESVKELTADIKDHFSLLARLVKSYATGEYREISLQGVALSLAALLYFVAPLDFIPDFLIVGLVDDIAVLMWVFNNYKKELEAFQQWEDECKTKIDI
jgi:uncharacterized membrane protein YkvA (DUF1232 family)